MDHRHGTLHFGSQQLESDKVRTHLSALASHLGKAAAMIDPAAPPETTWGKRSYASSPDEPQEGDDVFDWPGLSALVTSIVSGAPLDQPGLPGMTKTVSDAA